jgi:hypothetical protein
MGRNFTNGVVVVLGLLLIAAGLLFAWISSRRVSLPGSEDVAQRIDIDKVGKAFDWEIIGERTYQENCASCHAQGESTRRVPPLRDHVPNIFHADGGRTYLIDFILFGLEGGIQVNNQIYESRHPVYKDRLSNEEIAAALNYTLVSWNNRERLTDNAALYAPEEVNERRPFEFSRAQMQVIRNRLLNGR